MKIFFISSALLLGSAVAKTSLRKEDKGARRATETLLGECEVDCDTNEDCGPGLACADAYGAELEYLGLDKRKAGCGDVGDWNEEVCFDETILEDVPLDFDKLDYCEFDCDLDEECKPGLLCADEHKHELEAIGLDPRKAMCGDVGEWNEEVCFPACLITDCDDSDMCTIDTCVDGMCSNDPVDCDDGDMCTVDSCANGICSNEPVSCGENKVCDSTTGLCEDIQSVVPCIAVIDEWDKRNYDAVWASFRAQYPKRPFCLLIPDCNGYGLSHELPDQFENDGLSPDNIDRTIVAEVAREDGYCQGSPSISDWYSICELNKLSSNSVGFVGLFVDVSGSMTLKTVEQARAKFIANLEAANLAYAEVFNGSEEWIDPFFTSLAP